MERNNMSDRNRAKLLNRIQKLSLYIVDLTQYLDTHPDCRKAFAEFTKYQAMLDTLKNEYETRYGTLTPGVKDGQTEWLWVSNPWPWDRSINESEDK